MTRRRRHAPRVRAAPATGRAAVVPTPMATASTDGPAARVVVTIPGLRLVSEANAHAHWRTRSTRAARQRETVTYALWAGVGLRAPAGMLPAAVVITRQSPTRLDSDNATGSAKAVRDAIAAWARVDDGDARWHWVVRQAKGPTAVRIEIYGGARACVRCGGEGWEATA